MMGLIYAPMLFMTCFGVSIPAADGFHPKSLSNFAAPPPPHGPSDNISAGAWGDFFDLTNARKGDSVRAMDRLKQYLRAFGYLNGGDNMTECYDDRAESAVKLYQQSFGLPVTGNLDAGTLSQIMLPRCGVADIVHGTSTMFKHANHRGNANGSRLNTIE